MKRSLMTLVILGCAALAVAQQPQPPVDVPVEAVSLPTMMFFGPSYNQYTGWSGVLSGIFPEFQRPGIYGSVTADVTPVPYTDPKTKRTGYILSSSFRGGQHKVVYRGERFIFLLGGDFGASFASGTTVPVTAISVGMTGSFTATPVIRFSKSLAFSVPVRMLYLPSMGPNGSGAWNPVIEPGLVLTLGK